MKQPTVEEYVKTFLEQSGVTIPGFDNSEDIEDEDQFLYGNDKQSIQNALQGALRDITAAKQKLQKEVTEEDEHKVHEHHSGQKILHYDDDTYRNAILPQEATRPADIPVYPSDTSMFHAKQMYAVNVSSYPPEVSRDIHSGDTSIRHLPHTERVQPEPILEKQLINTQDYHLTEEIQKHKLLELRKIMEDNNSPKGKEEPSLEGILKSIGFNFEMSQVMQEKAKRERQISSNDKSLPQKLANDLICSLDEAMKKKKQMATAESYEERARRYLKEKELARMAGRESPVPFDPDELKPPPNRSSESTMNVSQNELIEGLGGDKPASYEPLEPIYSTLSSARNINQIKNTSFTYKTIQDTDIRQPYEERERVVQSGGSLIKGNHDVPEIDKDHRYRSTKEVSHQNKPDLREQISIEGDIQNLDQQAYGRWAPKSRWDVSPSKANNHPKDTQVDRIDATKPKTQSPLLNIRITTTQDNSERKIIEQDTRSKRTVIQPFHQAVKRSLSPEKSDEPKRCRMTDPEYFEQLRVEKEMRQKRLAKLEEELQILRRQQGK